MSLRLPGQALLWLVVAALIGVIAQWPLFSPLPDDHGELKLSLAHLTERMQPCRPLSAEERQALPPNMRMTERCERARASAVVELKLDGELLLAEAIRPAGLHRDGRAYLYRHWALPAGRYTLELALRDSPRDAGFDRQQRFELTVTPGLSALLKVGDGEAVLRSDQTSESLSRLKPLPQEQATALPVGADQTSESLSRLKPLPQEQATALPVGAASAANGITGTDELAVATSREPST